MAPGVASAKYLNTGDPNGRLWIPAETDVSIRPGWFWHEAENSKVRTPQNLVNLYYHSVGRNSLLLLNVPPNKDGLLEESDVRAIKSFREILDETFNDNIAGNLSASLTDKNISTAEVVRIDEPVVVDFKKKQHLTGHYFRKILQTGKG